MIYIWGVTDKQVTVDTLKPYI